MRRTLNVAVAASIGWVMAVAVTLMWPPEHLGRAIVRAARVVL